MGFLSSSPPFEFGTKMKPFIFIFLSFLALMNVFMRKKERKDKICQETRENLKGATPSVPGRNSLSQTFKLLELAVNPAKILQARLQQYVNHELPDVQAGFRKGRGTRDQIANILWIIEKARSSRKTSISALLTMLKPLTVWITINCGKF